MENLIFTVLPVTDTPVRSFRPDICHDVADVVCARLIFRFGFVLVTWFFYWIVWVTWFFCWVAYQLVV